MAENEFYRLELVVGVSGDEQVKGKLKAMDNFMEHTRKRGEMLNRMQVSPAVRLVDRISAPLRAVERNLNRLSTVKKVTIEAVDKTTDVIKRITGALTSPLAMLGGGAGLAAAIGFPLKLAGEMEQARISLDYFTGSAEKGKKMMDDLVAFAAKTPFEFPFLRDMATGLLPVYKDLYGVDQMMQKTMETIKAFGDAAGYTGASMDRIGLAMLGFKQIGTVGTLQLEDLRQVTENLGIPMSIVLKELGLTNDQLKDLGKLGIPASKAMAAIVSALEKNYGGGMKRLSRGYFGLVSTLKDTGRLIVTAFGTGMAEPVKRILGDLVGTLDYTSPKYKAFEERVQNVGKSVGEAFEKAYNRIKEFFGQLSSDEAFQRMSFSDKLVYAINQALDSVSNWLNGPGGKKVQDIFVRLGEIAAKAWLNGLEGMVKGAGAAILHGNILGGIGLLAGAGMLGGGMVLRSAWGLGKGIYGAGKWVAGKLGYGASATAEAATGVTETAATAAKPAGLLSRLSGAGRILGRIAVPLGVGLDLFSIFRAAPEERTAKIGEAVGRWGGMLAGAKLGAAGGAALGSIIPGVGTAIGAGVGGLLGGIAGAFGGEALSKKIMANWDSIKAKVSSTWRDIATGASSMGARVSQSWTRLKTSAATWFEGIRTSITTKLQNAGNAISQFFAQLPEKIGFAIGFMAGKIAQLPGFLASLPGRIGNFFMQIYTSASMWTRQTVDNVVNWFAGLPGRISSWLSQMVINISFWGQQIWASAVAWASQTVQGISAWWSSLPGRVSAWWAGVWSAVNTWAANTYSAVVNWFSSIPGMIAGWVSSAIDQITGLASSAWERIKSIGSRIAGGYRAGYEAAQPHALGGILTSPHLGLVAEAGPEAIIPLSARLRTRALDLWQRTGEYLGVKPYAVGGFAGPVSAVAGAGGGGSVNVTVAGITVHVAGNELDEDALALRIGRYIVGEIKKSLENRG